MDPTMRKSRTYFNVPYTMFVYFRFRATKVLKVTTQVVAGTLDTYTVELTSDNVAKQCTVKIWSQPWLKENGTNVKIECQGDDAKVDRTW